MQQGYGAYGSYGTPGSATGFQVTALPDEVVHSTYSVRRSPLEFIFHGSPTSFDRDLFLTSKRLILYETAYLFGFLPRGTSLRAAMIHEVDAVKTDRGRLPLGLLIAGLVLAVGGLALLTQSAGAILLFLIGAALVAAWFFIQPSVLAFNVAGAQVFTAPIFRLGTGDSPRITAFVEAFFAIKDVAPAPVTGLGGAAQPPARPFAPPPPTPAAQPAAYGLPPTQIVAPDNGGAASFPRPQPSPMGGMPTPPRDLPGAGWKRLD